MAAALALGAATSAVATGASGGAPLPIRFSVAKGRLTVTTPDYRLTLSAQSGAMLELVDRRTGSPLVRGSNGCMWGAVATDLTTIGGCAYSPAGPARFSYRWRQAASTLTLSYSPDPHAERRVQATVELTAGRSSLDVRVALDNRWGRPLHSVLVPADLLIDATRVRAGYAPNFLPGVRFRPSFFTRPGNNVVTYPGRWAFADYLALDVARSHLALYSVNPAPAPLAPVDLGFIRNGEPVPCSGPVFCVTHVFQTWIRDGETWSSPTVRLRVGGTVEDTILAYRRDNGVDRYPSAADKLGPRLDVLARAPLIKADPWKGLPPFRAWGPALGRLPSPALLHPVAFQPRGHDEDYPDFLPPDPRWGSLDDLRGVVATARSLGQLVMPYLNVSWWDDQSPSVQGLPPPLTPADIAMQTSSGRVVREQYGNRDGYVVSPWARYVRDRVAALMEEWRRDVPADCLFFDQIGARPWRRDFNPAAPSPLAYADGWLSLFAPYANRCLMVEDGWDRLGASFSGFQGGLLQMARQHDWPNEHWGAGTWEPYPLALWLLHDKVLFYQHDLYEGTMTADPEVLTFNLAFGLILSFAWDGEARTLDSPWMGLVGRIQRLLGPYYAGRPLTGFRSLGPVATETEFGGDYSLIANWSRDDPFDVDGYRIAPLGFLARTADGRVLAGAFGDAWSGVSFMGDESPARSGFSQSRRRQPTVSPSLDDSGSPRRDARPSSDWVPPRTLGAAANGTRYTARLSGQETPKYSIAPWSPRVTLAGLG